MARRRRLLGDDGHPLALELYMFEGCPYCGRVLQVIDELGLDVALRDIREDPEARSTLERVGGKVQVPCLFVDGEPMYESADIVAFLRSRPLA